VTGGRDLDDDGTLDLTEIEQTKVVCPDGTLLVPEGSVGAAGADGFVMHVEATTLPTSSTCVHGGTSYQAWVDWNLDGVHDAGESVGEPGIVCAGGSPSTGATLEGSYSIKSSADLAVLQGVQTITGALVVQDSGLTSLALPDLVSVGSLLILDNVALQSVALPQLQTVARNLVLHNNAHPLTITGLDQLQAVSGTLLISTNGAITGFPMLQSLGVVGSLQLSGAFDQLPTCPMLGTAGEVRLEGCSYTGGGQGSIDGFAGLVAAPQTKVYVRDNAGFGALQAFANLTQVHTLVLSGNADLQSSQAGASLTSVDTLEIGSNGALTGLPAFAQLATAGTIRLEYNDALTSLPPGPGQSLGGMFPALTSVTDTLSCSYNAELASFSGLSFLQSVGSLHLQGNPVLATMPTLPMLAQVQTEVRIEDNDLLSSSAIPPLATVSTIDPAKVFISNNGGGSGL
jgi:hypothetical protein